MNTESTLRKHALAIFRAALKAAGPAAAVQRHVRLDGGTLIVGRRRYALSGFRDVIVLGAGKASATMALALERMLGKRISGGYINVKHGHGAPLKSIHINECGHPVPDADGVAGAREIARMASEAGRQDLVFCLISGGGSALMPLPAAPIKLSEKQTVTQQLLACGANIHEINAIRKHISLIKGGQLARLAAPATVVSLLLSDVIGDSLDVIGSGPTAPDPSTFAQAWSILEKYRLLDRAPVAVRRRLQAGKAGEVEETPKPGARDFARVQNLVIGSNKLAVDAAYGKAKELGYRSLVLTTFLEGETREVARVHTGIAKEILAAGRPLRPPACVISGGETTVTLRGAGLGGRNQEFALAAALELDGVENVCLLSGGTDGTDGPTDAAGAIATGGSAARARALGLNPVAVFNRNDSYHLFDQLGDLIRTGPTGTNVMDVQVLLVGA